MFRYFVVLFIIMETYVKLKEMILEIIFLLKGIHIVNLLCNIGLGRMKLRIIQP